MKRKAGIMSLPAQCISPCYQLCRGARISPRRLGSNEIFRLVSLTILRCKISFHFILVPAVSTKPIFCTVSYRLYFHCSLQCTPNREYILCSECPTLDVDVLFLLDGSRSVGYENFERIKAWVKNIAGKIPKVKGGNVHFGVVQYSHYLK